MSKNELIKQMDFIDRSVMKTSLSVGGIGQ